MVLSFEGKDEDLGTGCRLLASLLPNVAGTGIPQSGHFSRVRTYCVEGQKKVSGAKQPLQATGGWAGRCKMARRGWVTGGTATWDGTDGLD